MKIQVEIDDKLIQKLNILDKQRLLKGIQYRVEGYIQKMNQYESLEVRLMLNSAYSPVTVTEILS